MVWGFPVNTNYRHQDDIETVIRYCREWQDKRDSLDYEIDGVVVKVNRLEYQDRLGVVSRDPRWAVAYKFPGKLATTRLLKIEINVGRTGALNPYAILEPVQLAGVTIRTATLHNEDDIRRKDIREGDVVIVKRAGDVIPQVVGPVREKRTGKEREFRYPEVCPACGAPVVREEGEAMVYCRNPHCPAQRLEALIHFVSQGAMDIRGLGPQTIEKLLDSRSSPMRPTCIPDRGADRTAAELQGEVDRQSSVQHRAQQVPPFQPRALCSGNPACRGKHCRIAGRGLRQRGCADGEPMRRRSPSVQGIGP